MNVQKFEEKIGVGYLATVIMRIFLNTCEHRLDLTIDAGTTLSLHFSAFHGISISLGFSTCDVYVLQIFLDGVSFFLIFLKGFGRKVMFN